MNGDILGRIGGHLIDLGAKRIFFTGKVGGLSPQLKPNISLATGNSTYVEGELLTWDDPIVVGDVKNVVKGAHISSPSVMFETKAWLKSVSERFDFVDPEVGQLGKSIKNKGGQFGYIHIVSNTLLSESDENLSNERDKAVLEKRDVLINQMRTVLITSI